MNTIDKQERRESNISMLGVDWGNLLSGLIGALAGGSLSYLGSVRGANAATQQAEKADRRRYERVGRDRQLKTLKDLLGEIRINLELIENPRGSHAKISLLNNAWQQAVGEDLPLEEETRDNLTKAYAHIHKYNEMCKYERAKVPVGHGTMDDAIDGQVTVVKGYLVNLEGKISTAVKRQS